jgi:protein-L-isoaspartate O-methyltransferase
LFCAYEWLDRAWFVKHGNQELYGNSALPLSTTDNMTTPIMHVIPAALLAPHITHGSRILDVGTGHGYIAMLLRRYADLKGYRDVSVKGLDVNEHLIQRARTLG